MKLESGAPDEAAGTVCEGSGLHFEYIDAHTVLICLQVPGSAVVRLQTFFELYEGVGTVRTLDVQRSLVCVITTASLCADCAAILNAIAPEVPWTPAQRPHDIAADCFLGYKRKNEKG